MGPLKYITNMCAEINSLHTLNEICHSETDLSVLCNCGVGIFVKNKPILASLDILMQCVSASHEQDLQITIN